MSRRTFVILCLEGALLSFNVAACAALVPSIAQHFALSQFFAARIVWVYMIPYGIAALLYGPLARAFDARKIELVCVFIFSLANLGAALSRTIGQLFLARFFMGLFGASVIPLGLILISKHIQEKERGRYVGLFFAATFVASLAGLFLSGILAWRLIFLIPAVAGIILFSVMFIYLPSFAHAAGAFSINYLQAFRDRAILSLFTYIFLISLVYHAVQQWLAVYFSIGLGFSQFVISSLITLTSLSGVFGEVWGGALADKIGRIKTVDLGITLMVFSVFALILKLPAGGAALVMVAWGLGWTVNHAGLSTRLTDLPGKFLNEAASLNSSIRFVAGGIGVTAGGFLMQRDFVLHFLVFGSCLAVIGFFARRFFKIKTEGG